MLFISCAGVTQRWGLPSHAQNAAQQVSRSSLKTPSFYTAVLGAAVF